MIVALASRRLWEDAAPMKTAQRLVVAALLLAACAHEPASQATDGGAAWCPYEEAKDGTQSYDTLCREPIANKVTVKHILIGWKELRTADHPREGPAAERTYAEAQELARQLLEKLRGGAAIEPLMAEFSEDPGSAKTGREYEVSPGSGMVSVFKSLSLRLNVGEAGIVKSEFGLHVIRRVK
jgi:hypothetical protein